MDISSVPCTEIIERKKVLNRYKDLIYEKQSVDVGKCLSRLDDNRVHSLAIMDEDGKNVLGLVDYLDLVIYLLETCVKKMESRVTPPSENLNSDDFEIIMRRSNEFHMRNILESKIIDKSNKNPLYEVPDTKPLWYVAEVFALGLHRVVLTSEDGHRTMFSQSDVVSWLSVDTEKKLGELSHKSVKDLDLGSKDVITISQDKKAIDAFFMMKEKNVSGLGVVDEDGSLVGNFSSSDLKGIRHFRFSGLLNSVGDFITEIKKRYNDHKSYVVWVIESTPFETVLKKFSEHRVHRIYVVQPETMKPISVITLTDVLSKLPLEHKNK